MKSKTKTIPEWHLRWLSFYLNVVCMNVLSSFKLQSFFLYFLLGRDQVLVGIVPRLCPLFSTQSAKSVYPMAIANCKENRSVAESK